MKTPEDTSLHELQQIISFSRAVVAERLKTTAHVVELISADTDLKTALTTLKKIAPPQDPSRGINT